MLIWSCWKSVFRLWEKFFFHCDRHLLTMKDGHHTLAHPEKQPIVNTPGTSAPSSTPAPQTPPPLSFCGRTGTSSFSNNLTQQHDGRPATRVPPPNTTSPPPPHTTLSPPLTPLSPPLGLRFHPTLLSHLPLPHYQFYYPQLCYHRTHRRREAATTKHTSHDAR